MVKQKYTCIVCGRVFPQGQGIVIKYGNIVLSFHSSRCASKFLKYLLENTPYEDLGKYVKNVYEEFLENLKRIREKKTKKI